MALIFTILASALFGGGVVGLQLSRHWRKQVAEAQTELAQIAELHQQQQQENKDLAQNVADLKYQLSQAQKDLNHYRRQNDE